LYRLLKKGSKWEWIDEEEEAINTLKIVLITAPALVSIDYLPGVGLLILVVNGSLVK
jgi:hypothetical protein